VSDDAPLPVGAPGDSIEVTLTLDTSAYAAGDVLADTQEINNAVRANGGRAILQSIVVYDQDDQKAAMDIYILQSSASLGTENNAPNISDANALNILGLVSVGAGDYKDLGGMSVANIKGIGMGPLEAASDSRDLYVGVVTQGTPTHSASGARIRFNFLWD
jgi:hypothetical protein